jgi:Uma2 family endonuclease
MNVMTTPDIWSDLDRMLTVDDMANQPDDEFRYELDDGVLIVSPAPSTRHQLVVARLATVLTAACPAELFVLPGVGINISKFQHRVPDLAVVRADCLDTMFQDVPPALAVEVASPRTGLYDRTRKKDIYEGFGIPAYWIVTLSGDRPELTVFGLHKGVYELTHRVRGGEKFAARLPFPVMITPDDLISTDPLR